MANRVSVDAGLMQQVLEVIGQAPAKAVWRLLAALDRDIIDLPLEPEHNPESNPTPPPG